MPLGENVNPTGWFKPPTTFLATIVVEAEVRPSIDESTLPPPQTPFNVPAARATAPTTTIVLSVRIGSPLLASMARVSQPLEFFGTAQLRTEDPRFLKGEGRYLDNFRAEHELTAWFVRSILAHARLTGVDTSVARSMPGVAGVFVASDLELGPLPPAGNVEGATGSLEGAFARPILASEVVRFVGEPIAVILAESAALAEDAAETVVIDYDPLEVVLDPEVAAADEGGFLFPEQGTNVCHSFQTAWEEDVLAGSDVVVSGRFVNQRLIPVPMETNAILVEPTEGDGLTIYV